MKKSRLVVFLACSFALCLSLAGCGSKASEADPKEAFLGTWSIYSIDSASSEYTVSADDIALMQSQGLDVTVTFNDDETCSLKLFDETMDGEWKAQSADSGTATIQGEEFTATLADGRLTLADGDEKLTFAKQDQPAANQGESNDGSSSGNSDASSGTDSSEGSSS